MEPALREKLATLNSRCQALQRAGKHLQCIDILQEILSIKKQVYGPHHHEFLKASQKLCEELNLASMVFLQKEKYDVSLDLLKKAEIVSLNLQDFKATTYNNLACYYRKIGKLRTALSYLVQALELQVRQERPHSLADTHLNLCAVLSQLDKHDEAMQHVLLSIILIQDEFLKDLLPLAKAYEQSSPNSEERIAVLAIAYHNLGVELEYTKRYEQAMKIYSKAFQITKENIPNNDQLLNNLQKVINSAEEQLAGDRQRDLEIRRARIDKGVSDLKSQIYSDLSKGFRIKQNVKNVNVKEMGYGRRRLMSRREGRYQQEKQGRKKYQSFTSKRGLHDNGGYNDENSII